MEFTIPDTTSLAGNSTGRPSRRSEKRGWPVYLGGWALRSPASLSWAP